MSFNGEHMKKENEIKNGVRGGTIILKETLPNQTWVSNMVDDQRAMMRFLDKFDTWEEFIKYCRQPQLYGNTKFIDHGLLPALFRNGMHMATAGEDVGYSVQYNNYGMASACPGYNQRMKRLNISSPFIVIEPFVKKGFITRERIARYINHEVSDKVYYSKFYQFYMYWYVTSAYKYFGENLEFTHNYLRANYTGLGISMVENWLKAEVEDIRDKR